MINSLSQRLADAWHENEADDFASQLARQSLSASVHAYPELQKTLTELKKPGQEELQLRLTGTGVVGHSTSPEALGIIYQEIATVVKAIGRKISGKPRWESHLLAVAPSAGSVEISFSAPALSSTQESFSATEVPGYEAQSLRQLVNLFAQASDDEHNDDVLLSQTALLPNAARKAIEKIATTARKNNWDIESTLEARNRETVTTLLTPKGASRLIKAAKSRVEKIDEITLTGKGDGWTWSTAKLRFIPENGNMFSASVPPPLQLQTAKLVATPDIDLRATFYRNRIVPSGSDRPIATVYSLAHIELLDD